MDLCFLRARIPIAHFWRKTLVSLDQVKLKFSFIRVNEKHFFTVIFPAHTFLTLKNMISFFFLCCFVNQTDHCSICKTWYIGALIVTAMKWRLRTPLAGIHPHTFTEARHFTVWASQSGETTFRGLDYSPKSSPTQTVNFDSSIHAIEFHWWGTQFFAGS